MKTYFWIPLLSGLLFVSCSWQKEESLQSNGDNALLAVPETLVAKSALQYNHDISLWTLNDLPYSGFAVTYYPDGSLKEKFGLLDGKKQNEAIQWYPDRHFKNVTNYHKGKMHGEKKTWSADSMHVLIAHFNFHAGKAHGEQTKWYPTGELFQKLNLNKGQEEGIQQAFRKNGALYANYEAREGRIFGLKKAALCFGLEDEEINSKEDEEEKMASGE